MRSKRLEVSVSLQWCREATRAIKRGIVLRMLINEMLDSMDTTTRAYWLERLRGVDNVTRLMYDGRQVTNRQQDNSNRGIKQEPNS